MSTASVACPVNTVRESFAFSVDKMPLSGPDGLRTPWYALFRSDTGTVVGNGSVTSKYVPHTTEDVVTLCEAASVAFDGIADVDCYFRDGHYVLIQPSKEQRLAVFGTADNIWPRVMIRAGYDGKAFKASIGWWRDQCKNMHITRQVRDNTVAIRHNGNLRSRMDELIEQFGQLKNSWASLENLVRTMESNRVNMVNFLDAIYGKPDESSKRAVTEHKNRTEAIFKRLQREIAATGRDPLGDSFEVSGWLAFNAIQGYVQHDTTRKGRNKNSDGAGLILALDNADVQLAEQLALAV